MIHETYFRDLQVETNRTSGQTFPASLSSETPVLRDFGWEILSHAPEAIELDRAGQGLPLLEGHKTDRLNIGRAGNVRTDGGKLRADLLLGKSARAHEVQLDIESGVLGPLSLGYQILEAEQQDEIRDGHAVFVVKRWRPLEVSLVSLPADINVGIGRSLNFQKDENMTERITTPTGGDIAVKQERERISELREYAKLHPDMPEVLVDRAIESGSSIHDVAKGYMAHKRKLQDVNEVLHFPGSQRSNPTLGLSPRESDRFSIVRAVRALASNDWREAGFEKDVSDSLAKQRGGDLSHIHIPLEILGHQQRAVLKSGSGANLIPSEYMGSSFIDVLRNRARTIEAGATVLNGLQGDVEIPRKTATSTAYWVGEGSDVTESTPAFDQVSLTPNTVGALATYSRKMILQSSPDIEQLMRADLAGTLAVELDRVGIEGSGSGAEPLGILGTSGIGDLALGTNGDYPAYADLVNLVKEVAIDNADVGKLGFLLSATSKAKLQLVEKATDTGLFVFEDGENGDGRIAGYRALVSNQVPDDLDKGTSSGICSAVIFGNWADLMVGNWGALEIALDHSTNFASGGVRIRALLDADVAVRHAQSFAAIQDMLTA